MTPTADPRVVAALRGLGVFLQDHAELAADYVAAAMVDVAGAPAAPQRPVADAPAIRPGAAVDLEAWWPSSPDSVWFKGAVANVLGPGDGRYTVSWAKEGKPDTGLLAVVIWADGRFGVAHQDPGHWRPRGNVPVRAPHRVALHMVESTK